MFWCVRFTYHFNGNYYDNARFCPRRDSPIYYCPVLRGNDSSYNNTASPLAQEIWIIFQFFLRILLVITFLQDSPESLMGRLR